MVFDFLSIGSKIGSAFGGAWDWLGKTDSNGTSNPLSVLGMAGNLYKGYRTANMAKKMFNLQKDAYDFNKMLSQRELQKENRAQQNLENAWANSAFGKAFKDARLKDDEEGQ